MPKIDMISAESVVVKGLILKPNLRLIRIEISKNYHHKNICQICDESNEFVHE